MKAIPFWSTLSIWPLFLSINALAQGQFHFTPQLYKLNALEHLHGVNLTSGLSSISFSKGAIFHRYRLNDIEALYTAPYSYTIFFDKQEQQTAQMLFNLSCCHSLTGING